MTAPVSSSLSAARTPPNASSYPSSCCSSQPSRPQVYCGPPRDLPRSSYSQAFSVSISALKLHPFFLHHRFEKARTRRIHGQVCRSLSFSFHSDESTEDMDGQERESASRHLADKASARDTATLSKKDNFNNFGQDKGVGVYPSPHQKPNDGSFPQKNAISGRSRFQGEFYASISEVETDILSDAVEASKFSFNEEEKRRYFMPQRDDQESMAQKHIPPQSSRFQNPFYASRITVELDHSSGANASENSANGQDKQPSLYSNQLVETGHQINVVNSLKFSANKANQRSLYGYQQLENDQGNRHNPSLSKQEKQPSLYSNSQQINNPQDSFHNRKPPDSIRTDNDGEQSTAYSSKLEEILAKFKKKPGFHKDPGADRANDFRSQHVEAEMVQDKDVMSRLKKEGRQGSRINRNASEGGRKTTQYQHKQGRSPLFNDKVDLFGKEKPFMAEVDGRDSLSQKSLFSLSGSSSTTRKTKRRHTSESIGSRSKPSRLSVPSSNAVDKSQERILSVEQDDEEAISREKSPLNRSGSSNIPWKAKREHTLSSKILIQTKPGGNTLSSTGSHSSLSRTLAPSSDEKSLGHGERHKMSVKQSDNKENDSKIAKSERGLNNRDVPLLTIQDFGNSINETDIDTSDSGDEYDSSWSIDSDNDEPDNSFTERHDCSNKTSSGSSLSEVMDSNVSSSPNDKPSVATWHKHSIPDIPFEFQYSYTETPNIPIVRYRETPFSPFGPLTMERPWTGRAPLKPSKKKLPEFDSFKPPPKGKKGVKFVQDPGPFPKGEGPKPSRTREEIMGEPLTKEEITELVERCHKERRQLNLGRDGLTHNMLDLIHCHWKRRRVCKIKCIGVPTLDMKNVCFHVEDKTGGKIIYQTGGILYLYRGRNYNYKDRPKIPIMLWRPVTPVYPKLIQEAPAGLTKEEANKLRQLGEKVEPMCKLGKNGVYLSLVEDTRAAFKIDELVRIDCRGLNPSDYKKIGAKLRDLVPCELLSFDNEHILMWKGNENHATVSNSQAPEEDDSVGQSTVCEDSHVDESSSPSITLDTLEDDNLNKNTICSESESFGNGNSMHESEKESIPTSYDIVYESNEAVEVSETPSLMDTVSHMMDEKNDADLVYSTGKDETLVLYIDDLWESAIASGMALELSVGDVDSDEVAKKSRELAKSAPIGPSYTEGLIRQLKLKTPKIKKPDELRIQFGKPKKKQNRLASRPYKTQAVDVPPSGGLPVTELARLLASR